MIYGGPLRFGDIGPAGKLITVFQTNSLKVEETYVTSWEPTHRLVSSVVVPLFVMHTLFYTVPVAWLLWSVESGWKWGHWSCNILNKCNNLLCQDMVSVSWKIPQLCIICILFVYAKYFSHVERSNVAVSKYPLCKCYSYLKTDWCQELYIEHSNMIFYNV